jgi:Ca2+-binding EF-hand superfamily protein
MFRLQFLKEHGLLDNDQLDISRTVVKAMLDDIDLNSDSQLDFEEFKDAFIDYFSTTS